MSAWIRARRRTSDARLFARAAFTLGYVGSVFAVVAAAIYWQTRAEAAVATRRADDLAGPDVERRIAALDYYSLSIREDWERPVRCDVIVHALDDTGAVREAARAALVRLVRSGDCSPSASAQLRLTTDSIRR